MTEKVILNLLSGNFLFMLFGIPGDFLTDPQEFFPRKGNQAFLY